MSDHRTYAAEFVGNHVESYPVADSEYEALYTSHRKTKDFPIPNGLNKQDESALVAVREGFDFLDERFTLFGTRFGWGIIIGFGIPLLGSLIELYLSHKMIISRAKESSELPEWLKEEMMKNWNFVAMLGFIPFFGRLIAAFYGANGKNERIFEDWMRVRASKHE